MALFDDGERRVARAAADLAFTNPFLPTWVELEKEVLGNEWVPRPSAWSLDPASEYATEPGANPNLKRLHERGEQLAKRGRERLATGATPGDRELDLYVELLFSVLYFRYEAGLYHGLIAAEGAAIGPVSFYDRFRADVEGFLAAPGRDRLLPDPPEHLLALFFQFRRAFHWIFRHILGGSEAAGQLRATVWQSIFTHDMRRYRRRLFARMHDIATLICGPSGTGKELVARAIGLSRYIPFDPKARRFVDDYRTLFLPLNLSALSPTLIESELFGHRRGAFTGAVADRAGYLEGKSAWHSVFLDEIGEVDVAIQVKLLRVLESRTFQRLGESTTHNFGGKTIAATNRDLAEEIEHGRFRTDLYFRLCSDLVTLPSLAEQLRGNPNELPALISLVVRRILGEAQTGCDDECDAITAEVVDLVERDLPADYGWPGNMRELEQCVRNVLVRRAYRPQGIGMGRQPGPGEQLARDVAEGRLTADELLSRYCGLVYQQEGQYEAAARRLGLDRRTVKARIRGGSDLTLDT